jgi:nucleoside-diphosphate-sugar epimerase
MEKEPAEHSPRRRKLGKPRLLIVGCGDVGLRIVARQKSQFRIVALTSSPQRRQMLRDAGAVPLLANLDDRRTLDRLRAFHRVIHLAPPDDGGDRDRRTRHLIAALRGTAQRLVYVSTSGVYGDRGGAWIDETATPAPSNPRDRRRLDAEAVVRSVRGRVLRVPAIYAHDRFPLALLRSGVPMLAPQDDVITNRIHADDLARICVAALWRGRSARVYNAVDDLPMPSGEYFDRVADHFGVDRPRRLPRGQFKAAVSPMLYSFLSDSRRLGNRRMKCELRVRLAWPTVLAALACAPRPG